MDSKVMASGIASSELANAVSELVSMRWDDMDLSPFMAYLVDVCDANILPYLAEQFDVTGLQGFEVAETEQQKRDIIKRSIALHKYIGTPWAIREACRTVGFPVISIDEGVTATPGGPTSPDDWARFRVLIDIGTDRAIDASQSRKLRQFVESYKNERSHLINLGYWQALSESDSVFRPSQNDRDNLDVEFMTLKPNPVFVSKTGLPATVAVSASDGWMIRDKTEWDDGGVVDIHSTGAAGDSVLTITSSRNDSGDNRTMTVPLLSSRSGRKVGDLKIIQLSNWNAYSSAYSSAYNSSWINKLKHE